MGFIEGQSRDQLSMFPAHLDDYVGIDHEVRVIDRYVDVQDLRSLGFARFEPAATGRPGYDPRLMLKLYVYGYLHRVRSSRRLEGEARRNVELMWLLGRLAPDFKSIADFRRDNGPALRSLCRSFSVFCVQQGLMKGELVAIDGSKFAGVNHRGRNFSAKVLARQLAALDARIAAHLEAMDRHDADEACKRPDPEAVRQALAQLQGRKAALEGHQKTLAETGASQVSLTDPDTRAMRGGTGGAGLVGYNVQLTVDAQHKLIVNFEVTQDGNDLHQLARQAQAAKDILGVQTLTAVADTGYAHGADVAACDARGITPYVPIGLTNNAARKGFTKADFRYDALADTYTCPAGQLLTHQGTTQRDGLAYRLYRTPACKGCPLRGQCTTARRHGREIERSPYAAALEALAQRVALRPDLIALRKTLVEHPFGTIKRAMHQGYFLLKRIPKVSAEMSLTVLSYNLRRVMNILGAQNLIRALQPA